MTTRNHRHAPLANRRAWARAASLLLGLALLAPGCEKDPEDIVSSRAYKGHANDLDVHYFVNEYPDTVGTRLDDCQTCHRGKTFTYESSGQIRSLTKTACDYCHLVIHPDPDGFIEPQPTSFAETLNPFGAAYLAAGRSRAALRAIAGDDSDGDSYANDVEIADLKYPGDASSMPGQQVAEILTFELADLEALTDFEQFLLANANKQQFDYYASYRGVKVLDLLVAAGVPVDASEFEGITVIAPDGYLKDFSREEILEAYPQGLFYAGLDVVTLGTDCGFVEYPDVLPQGLTDGGTIPGIPWLQLAWEREGLPLDPSTLDPTSGKINGEGPYRVVVPQLTPGAPDRGLQYSPTNCNDGHDYDASFDHNAGAMVKGVIAIRVNPLPAGVEDFDYLNGGYAYVDAGQVLIYGFGVQVQ